MSVQIRTEAIEYFARKLIFVPLVNIELENIFTIQVSSTLVQKEILISTKRIDLLTTLEFLKIVTLYNITNIDKISL